MMRKDLAEEAQKAAAKTKVAAVVEALRPDLRSLLERDGGPETAANRPLVELWKQASQAAQNQDFATALGLLAQVRDQVAIRERTHFETVMLQHTDIHRLITSFLNLRDQAALGRTSQGMRYLHLDTPVALGIRVRNIVEAMAGYSFVGLHATSSTFSQSLYAGLRVPTAGEQVSDFNQLSSGFYLTEGTSAENRAAADTFGREAVIKRGGKMHMHRVFVRDFPALRGSEVGEENWIKEQRDVKTKGDFYGRMNQDFDYLRADIHKFKGATQIKVNPRAMTSVRVLPPLDEQGNIDPQQLLAWLEQLLSAKGQKGSRR